MRSMLHSLYTILQKPTLQTPFRPMTKNQCWRRPSGDGNILREELVRRMAFSRKDQPARSRRRMALPKALKEFMEMPPYGHVAEWLRSGLQNRLPRFNSGRGLHDLAK